MKILILGLWAAAQASDLLRPFPATVRRNEVVEFKPALQHHFSLEAPQKCAASRPVEASARLIKCQFLASGESSATLNVCDDGKTFCKPVTVSLQVSDQTAPDPVRLVKNESLNNELKKTLVPGFTVGTPDEILVQAAAKKGPVLVMISTDWCPPCNEAKEYLLVSPAFQNVTKDWFKVYVDGDSLAAVAWEKRVPYKYYPSFVLLNHQMEEVARYNGELRQEEFAAWAAENTKYLKDPIHHLQDRVLARKDGSWMHKLKDLFQRRGPGDRHADEVRLVKWALDQKKDGVIQKVTAGTLHPELKAELTRYEIGRISENPKPDKARQIALLAELVEASFNREDWAEAVGELCEAQGEKCQVPNEKIEERLKFLNSRPGLTDAERASMLGEEYLYLADLFDKAKDPARKRIFANKCVEAYDKLNSLSRLKLARGAQQSQLACFEMAERYAEAEKRLKALIEIYPNEPTFMVRMARLFRKQKKPDQALKWLEKSESVAYGFNWFTAQMIKSDVLLDLKRDQEAAKVLEEALAEVRLTAERDNRNQIVAARLRAAQTKILSSSRKTN